MLALCDCFTLWILNNNWLSVRRANGGSEGKNARTARQSRASSPKKRIRSDALNESNFAWRFPIHSNPPCCHSKSAQSNCCQRLSHIRLKIHRAKRRDWHCALRVKEKTSGPRLSRGPLRGVKKKGKQQLLTNCASGRMNLMIPLSHVAAVIDVRRDVHLQLFGS